MLWTAIRWNCRPCIPVHKGHLSFLLFRLTVCGSVTAHTERCTVFAVRCIAERHGQRYKSSGFFAVLTWFGNSRVFLPLFPNVVPARRIAPGVPVPVGLLALLRSWQILRRGPYPIRTVIRFSRYRCCYKNSLAKKCALSRISKRSEKSAKQGRFPRLETERRSDVPCR